MRVAVACARWSLDSLISVSRLRSGLRRGIPYPDPVIVCCWIRSISFQCFANTSHVSSSTIHARSLNYRHIRSTIRNGNDIHREGDQFNHTLHYNDAPLHPGCWPALSVFSRRSVHGGVISHRNRLRIAWYKLESGAVSRRM